MNSNVLKKINFNNNQFSPLSAEVQAAMKIAIETYADSLVDGFGDDYNQFAEIEEAKEIVAQSINLNSNELYFTHSSSQAEIQLIDKAVFFLEVKQIVTSDFESKNKLEYLKQLEKDGLITVFCIPCSQYGELDVTELIGFLEKNQRKTFISLSHANVYTGVLLPVKEIYKISKKYNSFFHLNAQLTFGRFQLNFKENKPDFVSFDTTLQSGPVGVGCLMISENLQIDDERYHFFVKCFKVNYVPNITLIAGVKTAIDIAANSIIEKQQDVICLKNYLAEQLKEKLDVEIIDSNLKKNSLFNQLAFFLPQSQFGKCLFEKLDFKGVILPHFEYPVKNKKDSYFISIALNEKNNRNEVDAFISALYDIMKSVNKNK